MIAALSTEADKFFRSRVTLATTVMQTLGIGILLGSMLLAVQRADAQTIAKFGALANPGGWPGYLTSSSQVTAVAALLGFGVVLSWLFGREFADGTITGLFALPVGRGTLALAKVGIFFAWAVIVSIGLVVALVGLGFVFGLGALPMSAWPAIARQLIVTLLTALLALPAAWVATLGRGLLPGIGTTIGTVVLAQVAAIGGFGAWVPFAAPGLWAISGGLAVSPGQLMLVVPVSAAFITLTVLAWRRLQLDR
ncbi:MAG: ABC transporter permease [Salinibacterium sp.]|nr:ABC transporter permease [Salinibacterium sp.]